MSDALPDRLDGTLFGADQPCFGCGPKHPFGFHLAVERDGDEVVTRFTPGPHHQSAPGIMHGGLVATLADELAGWAIVAQHGKFGFTTEFSARYPRPTRIGVEIEGRARCVAPPRRLVSIETRLLQEGTVVFTGTFRFAVLDRAAAERMLGMTLPEDWVRFSR